MTNINNIDWNVLSETTKNSVTNRKALLDLARIELLLKQGPAAIITSIVASFLISIMLWKEITPTFIVSWLILVVVIGLFRLFVIKNIQNKLANSSVSYSLGTVNRYELVLSVGAFCSGLLLGVLGLFIDPDWSIATQFLIPFALAGITAGATTSNSSSLTNYYCFIFPVLLPLSYGLYLNDMGAAALLVLIYLIIMVLMSKRINAVFVEGMNLKIHNTDLVLNLTKNNLHQQQLLKKLRSSEQLSSGAFNNAGVAMGLIDSNMQIFKVNQASCDLSGYSEDELTKMPMLDLTHQSDRAQSKQLFEDLINGIRQQYQLRKRYTRKNGESIWVNVTVSTVNNDNGDFEYAVVHAQDISQEYQLTQKLTHQAQHDALTELPNRYAFEMRLQELLDLKDNDEHVLCYLDLDQFKVVNDTCGHIAGDEVLRQLATVLKQGLRKSDLLARIGGDEFAVLMFNCSLDAAKHQLELLLTKIRDFHFIYEEHSFNIGASMGLVVIDAQSTMTEALKHADSACYAAKEAGRDRLHVYTHDDEFLTQRSGEMAWVARIQRALLENSFLMYRQEIVATNGNDKSSHYELLIRMKEDDGTIISPGMFLPAAERYNLAAGIDSWVVNHVVNTLVSARNDGKKISGIYNINLSGHSLGDTRFYDEIIKKIQQSKLDESDVCICFEITETAAISNMTAALHFITELRAVGCQFALDDFGSGLSSFAYLKQLPIDYLKIDGMFVRDCLSDPVNLEMIDSINSIGHVMGLKTVAEFVENDEIFNKIQEVGVDYAQGYWNGKPQPWIID